MAISEGVGLCGAGWHPAPIGNRRCFFTRPGGLPIRRRLPKLKLCTTQSYGFSSFRLEDDFCGARVQAKDPDHLRLFHRFFNRDGDWFFKSGGLGLFDHYLLYAFWRFDPDSLHWRGCRVRSAKRGDDLFARCRE